MHTCKNNSNQEMGHLEQIVGDFFPYSQQKLGFDKPVTIIFQSDEDNSMKILGKTAYYNPDVFEVVLYVDGRHPKDIMRSLSHELVHHAQNCRGDFHKPCSTEPGYAQKDPHLRKMEREAYTKGNLIFRDYEDLIKTGKKEVDIDFSKSGEPKMSLKEWKNNEINSKLMKKWGFLKEGLEAFASAEEEDETSGAPASDAADLDEKHDHPGESCEEAHPGASHEKFEAGLRGQGGGPGDEHYQFDKKEREGELEETGISYRDDDDPTGRPTRRYDNPIPVVAAERDPVTPTIVGDPEIHRDEYEEDPSSYADPGTLGMKPMREPHFGTLGRTDHMDPNWYDTNWDDEKEAWKAEKKKRFAAQFKEGKISVREAKEITLRIIERVRKEGK